MVRARIGRRTRIATVLGTSIAVGALLVLAMLPAATSAIRLERPAVVATANTSCATGASPSVPGYDPVNHYIYVPNSGITVPGSISVFNETCHLVKTISLPSNSEPFQAAFDPSNNYMYVTDDELNVVYVISGTKIIQTITGFNGPEGITFDPLFTETGSGGSMDVVDSGDNLVVSIIGGGLQTLFSTGDEPYEIVFDGFCGCDVVTNSGSDTVTVYVVTVGQFTMGVGMDPLGIACDLATGADFVANSGSNNVTVLYAWADLYGASIPGFNQPDAVAWDQADLGIYVANAGNGKVFELGGTNGQSIVKKYSTAAGSLPFGLAYDEFNGMMYVTGGLNNRLYVLP
jgi:DNA-binding beta-propeller fold protein YncE